MISFTYYGKLLHLSHNWKLGFKEDYAFTHQVRARPELILMQRNHTQSSHTGGMQICKHSLSREKGLCLMNWGGGFPDELDGWQWVGQS